MFLVSPEFIFSDTIRSISLDESRITDVSSLPELLSVDESGPVISGNTNQAIL